MCVGSFVNAYVYRLALGYELFGIEFKIKNRKRSFCDFCGKKLHWYENIPVFSFFIQAGKSRCCQKNLPLLYPVIEVITGLLFVQINNNIKNPYLLIISLFIVGFSVFSAVFDLKYMILPDFSTYILIFLAFLYQLFNFNIYTVLSNLMVGLSCYSFFYFLHLFTNGKGMGFGDVKLAYFLGFFLGIPKVIVSIYVAFIIGAFLGISLVVILKKGKKTVIPFGPLMILGIITSWQWGDVIWQYAIKVLY